MIPLAYSSTRILPRLAMTRGLFECFKFTGECVCDNMKPLAKFPKRMKALSLR